MIRLKNLTVEVGSFSLRNINLTVPVGAYAILMGPTACGKTTLVETICGLRSVSHGQIFFEDEDVTRLAPFSRRVGYVPQDSVLFPMMRVDHQIEFSLKTKRIKKSERRQRVAELAQLMGISGILKRYPQGLSGGEQQRVALARALASRPRIICLDEPLSALDEKTKSQMAALLNEIYTRERVSILHITHNSAEARQLGTIHFQFENGAVVQDLSFSSRDEQVNK